MEQPSVLDWEALKPEIRQLYLLENKTLSQVVATLKSAHNIRVLTYGSPPNSTIATCCEY